MKREVRRLDRILNTTFCLGKTTKDEREEEASWKKKKRTPSLEHTERKQQKDE